MNIQNKKYNKGHRGYLLIETLFYICFFVILSVVVINAMIIMAKSYRETSIQSQLVQSSNIMERISREIRKANSIDPSSTATDLILNTSGVNSKIEFKLLNSNIQVWETIGGNTTLTGNLNSANISVSNLSFTQISTAKGTAVKVVFSVSSNLDSLGRVENFQNTIILRGDY